MEVINRMNFLQWLDRKVHDSAMHIELFYNKTCDWMLCIYKKGCALDGGDIVIFDGQECEIDLLLAKAEVAVKEWLSENEGGY